MTNYSEMSLAELRAILRANNVAGYSSMRKAEMVALLEKMNLSGDDNNEEPKRTTVPETAAEMNTKTEDQLSSTNVEKETASAISEPSITESVPSVTESEPSSAENAPSEQRREAPVERRVHGTVTRRTVGRTGNAARGETAENRDAGERGENAENRTPVQQGDPSDSGIVRRGIFEICSDNYGFLRNDNYLPSEHDVYINPSMIRRYNLTTGDVVEGTLKRVTPGSGEKFVPLHHITKINNRPDKAQRRPHFH